MRLIEILVSILSTAALCTSLIIRPGVAQCPRGWFVNGVRQDGTSECIMNSDGPIEIIKLKIYCSKSEHPEVYDERTIGCRPTK